VNVEEAKSILMLYRPGTADTEEPQVAEALALAKTHPELSLWLEMHVARQEALRAKFTEIVPPAGLKEQIISEHAAGRRPVPKRPAKMFAMVAVLILLLGALALVWFPRDEPENTLPLYQNEMVSTAERGYGMDLMTNDVVPVRAYLAQAHAPADFRLPPPLQKTALAGCAVEVWQGVKVSLVCFRTGKPLQPGAASDLWLFVVDRASVKNAPASAAPQFAKINRLITATWAEGGKLYFLGVEGEQPDIKPYL
jgi:hypothetical protein